MSEFTRVTLPPGSTATLHAFVPIGAGGGSSSTTAGAAGVAGAHSANALPNMIDPLGGWTDTGDVYMEGGTGSNCLERHHYRKTIHTTSYTLHHTTTREWGYVYFVELNPQPTTALAPANQEIWVTDVHQANDCGPVIVPFPKGCTNVNCDRVYTFGADFNTFFQSLSYPNLIQDAHDPNDMATSTIHNQFAQLNIPAGQTAEVYALVPVRGTHDD